MTQFTERAAAREAVRAAFEESGGTYGYRRIYAQVNSGAGPDAGIGEWTVRSIMRQDGLAARTPKRRRRYSSEPCQYNGQRNRRFLCGQHGFRIGLEGILEAVEELLHGLCRHAVPDGFVRTEAVVV